MGKNTIEVHPGDIFMIPLYLPSYQKWTRADDYLDYRKYNFRMDDIYVFGRLIEIQAGHVDLVEVFSYTGKIPENPERIIVSGRMFAPEHVGHSLFEKGRWRVIFSDSNYDMWRDSDYENISFLSPVGHMWKGKEKLKITKEKCKELEQAGVPYWTMNGGIDIEAEIRSLLEKQGIELNYEQIVEGRKSEYPQPRDADKKLKETIAPFRWMSEHGRYTLILDTGLLNQDCFIRNHMLGNGYDWEKVAAAFGEKQGMDFGGKFRFDCEADTFCMYSSSKKMLKEFAIAFHKFAMDTDIFEKFLEQLYRTKK